jgi:hypothetical protein
LEAADTKAGVLSMCALTARKGVSKREPSFIAREPYPGLPSMPSARRFPPPWTIDEANDACFIVKDHNGYASLVNRFAVARHGFIVMTSGGCLGVEGKGRAPRWRLTSHHQVAEHGRME